MPQVDLSKLPSVAGTSKGVDLSQLSSNVKKQQENDNITLPNGAIVSKSFFKGVEPTEENYFKLIENRPDNKTFNASEIFDNLNHKIAGYGNKPLAVAGSLALEVPRFIAETIADPLGLAAGVANKFMKGVDIVKNAVETPFIERNSTTPNPEPIIDRSKLLVEKNPIELGPPKITEKVETNPVTGRPKSNYFQPVNVGAASRRAKGKTIEVPVKIRSYERPTPYDEVTNQLRSHEANVDHQVMSEVIDNPDLKDIGLSFLEENSSKNPFATIGTRLKSLGQPGVELYRRAAKYGQDYRFNLNRFENFVKPLAQDLSAEERANFGKYVEGTLPIPNDAVRKVINNWKIAADEMGDRAVSSGMLMDDETPFTKLSNYWPRKLNDEDLENLPKSIDKLIKQGMTRQEAEDAIKKGRKFGELILPFQHERAGKEFNYRTDFDSGLEHIGSMSRQLAKLENFGRRDIIGKGEEGIADLIEHSSNPELANQLMRRVVGRDEKVNENLNSIVKGARSAVSWARLQNYGLSSIVGNQLPNMLQNSVRDYVGSLKNIIARDADSKKITDTSAAAIDLAEGVFEHSKKITPMKLYGGNFTENLVRNQAAGLAYGRAKTLFRELKLNPNNEGAAKDLFELVLENPKKLLSQGELTERQLQMAAGRGAEIAQGLTNPLNLPYNASTPIKDFPSALLQTMLIFKKSALIQTKVVKDAIKKNPAKALAILTAFSQIGGGAIVGGKSVVKGLAKSALNADSSSDEIGKEFTHHSDYLKRSLPIKTNKITRDAIDRTLNSWMLGIGSDLIYSALDSGSGKDFLLGPVLGGGADLLGKVGKPKALAKEIVKMAPIPGALGTPIAEKLFPAKN